ncbi:unnamed protein product, partial [Prorocentrum cordatum]
STSSRSPGGPKCSCTDARRSCCATVGTNNSDSDSDAWKPLARSAQYGKVAAAGGRRESAVECDKAQPRILAGGGVGDAGGGPNREPSGQLSEHGGASNPSFRGRAVRAHPAARRDATSSAGLSDLVSAAPRLRHARRGRCPDRGAASPRERGGAAAAAAAVACQMTEAWRNGLALVPSVHLKIARHSKRRPPEQHSTVVETFQKRLCGHSSRTPAVGNPTMIRLRTSAHEAAGSKVPLCRGTGRPGHQGA